MNSKGLQQRFKLAAIDLDGTLLGTGGKISRANFEAVQRMQTNGIQVVLASGRHHINMRGYAEELPGIQWMVSSQGSEASDVTRERVLGREFLPMDGAREVLALGQSLGLTPITYTVDDTLMNSEWNDGLEFYANLSGYKPRRVSPEELASEPLFKILWVGNEESIDASLQHADALGASLQTVRTHERLLEFMPRGVSKASALKFVTDLLDVKPSEVVTFGDGDNDVTMFEWSGASVAMAHGWPSAIRAATYTSPEGDADTALARAVDLIFEKEICGDSLPSGELAPMASN